MDYEKHFIKCDQCEKEFLVEITQFGISHINSISVICRECISDDMCSDEYKKDRPEDYKELLRWINLKDK